MVNLNGNFCVVAEAMDIFQGLRPNFPRSEAKAITFWGLEILAQVKGKKLKFTLKQAITTQRGKCWMGVGG